MFFVRFVKVFARKTTGSECIDFARSRSHVKPSTSPSPVAFERSSHPYRGKVMPITAT